MLYYFMKREHLEYFLATGNLKVTQLSKSNDPLEFLPNINNLRTSKNWQKIMNHNEPLVICLSSKVSSAAIWGHYADSHTGVCLAFEIPLKKGKLQPLSQNLYEYEVCNYDSTNKSRDTIIKVDYVEEREYKEPPALDSTEDFLKFLDERYHTATATKSIDWSFENEYRLVIDDKSPHFVCDKNILFYNGLKPFFKGLILGTRCDLHNVYARQLLDNNGYTDVRLDRAQIHSKKYCMTIGAVTNPSFKDSEPAELLKWVEDYGARR